MAIRYRDGYCGRVLRLAGWSSAGEPRGSRERCSERARALGAPLHPADDYEPEDLDGWEPIRVNGTMYGAAKLTREQLSMPFLEICRELGMTPDEVQIIFARMLLNDAAGHPVPCRVLTSLAPDEVKNVPLDVLANSGWEPCERGCG
jgi:hypothetical protein